MEFIDGLLNSITMYRLVLYYLIVLVLAAIVFSFFGILPYNPVDIAISTLFILAVSYITNAIFAKTFEATTNSESFYITALILALVIAPATSVSQLGFLFWASVWAMASKYIFAVGKKHIFNPVAIAVVITAYFIQHSANWWVGNFPLLPLVLIGGLLIARKIRRFEMVLAFFAGSLAVILSTAFLNGLDILQTLQKAFVHAPILFFAFIMLTEPQTTPPVKKLRILYGALVGILFAPQFHIGSFYTTPEIALVIGNVFSYIFSSKEKLLLNLSERIRISSDVYDFIFPLKKKFSYLPGQYMEWTLKSSKTDNRGNRRYFTIASSPTEKDLRIGVKFYPNSSSFKWSLAQFNKGSQIYAGQLAGDFTMPNDKNSKLVFVAGGIGVTPFRSMAKYLIDRNENRDIVLLYSAKTEEDLAYKDIFESAKQIGLKPVYALTAEKEDHNWQGERGYINRQMIEKNIPDFAQRTFYISGPQKMVDDTRNLLSKMGVSKVKTDYFPGF